MVTRELNIFMPRLSFRQFIEDMDPSMDKTMGSSGKKADFFDGAEEELGIDWSDLSKILEGEPWVSAHFPLGSQRHKLAAWEIVPGSLNKNGASIRLKSNTKDRSYLPGNYLNKSSPDTKVYHLNRKQLIDFLTTGWSPAVQQAQGMGGGMPDASGGMGMPPDMSGGAPPGI